MRLYERLDNATWRAAETYPYSIVGDSENRPEGVTNFEVSPTHCACLLIPAPAAEAKVRAWAEVEKWYAESMAGQLDSRTFAHRVGGLVKDLAEAERGQDETE